ncbi:ImmA/IrrE family metallo-endopeptidase [Burkholderia vietnamiensis]|uniref:ImmA/IrrE family metallo-endopeptidase n=1 Tax=Burkholderia vietnamiensis TaxID=60552 RepID=UPI002650EE41|nr:helix-turn-helix transcriptional regulator [Burkholderia vietnamiensis]MDN7820903.1 helix-turn-helix transcriptional regulator [Burkholderia vietnamiensis]
MLNLKSVQAKMAELGLTQAAVAEQCGVSKEAVSNWLSGESIPRPKKLRALSETLGLEIDVLTAGESVLPSPVVAYRTKKNRPASGQALEAAAEVASHLRELVPFTQSGSLFSPPVLQSPSLDEDYIRRAAQQTRQRIGISEVAPLTREQLIGLHRTFGSILVPVLWGEGKSGHENALSVYLPESKTSCVVFSLNARNDDFNYWLAHELAHCYTLHAIQGDDGEMFAERFAQELLFPHAAAEAALLDICSNPSRMERALYYAQAHDISIVTVIRQIDRVAKLQGAPSSGLETDEFWEHWNANRTSVPTVGHALFGAEKLDLATYVCECERIFGTPIFQAIARWQQHEGGRSPSFIAAALNMSLENAVELSRYLVTHCSH